jgi:hypothetical protein
MFKLIKLDGTKVMTDGTEQKSSFFKFLELQPDDYSDIAFTPEEANKIRGHLCHLSTGSTAAIPLTCFLPDSKVVMEDGTLKDIQDIKVGDKVFTHLGRSRAVKKVMQHEVSEAVFSFRAGNKQTRQWTSWVTGGHLYCMPTENSWKEAANLQVGDYLLAPFYSLDIPLSEQDLAWAVLLGFYLAEGSGQVDRRDKNGHLAGDSVQFTFHIEEKEYEEEIISACKILGFTQISIYEYPERNTRRVIIFGKEPVKTLVELGGRLSHCKRLHTDVVQKWPRQKQLLMLKKYLQGDGHFRGPRNGKTRTHNPEWSWKTVSKDMSEQLHTIALMSRLVPSRPTYYDPENKKRTYCSYLGAPTIYNLDNDSDNERICKYLQVVPEGIAFRISKVRTKFYKGPVYNLEVEEDNSYCVDWLAVHNCGGIARCPFASKCPLIKIDKERREKDSQAKLVTPVGKSCLIESNLLLEWTRLYIKEYEIDEDNFTEFQMVRELAEIELMLWRLNNNISKPENANLTQDTVVGIDKQGNVLTRVEISALFEAKERLQNRKSRLIKLMVGDRQEKYKREAALKMKSEDDPSINAAKLRGQIDRLLHQAKNLDIQLKAAEGKVIEVGLDSSSDLLDTPEKPIAPEDLIED